MAQVPSTEVVILNLSLDNLDEDGEALVFKDLNGLAFKFGGENFKGDEGNLGVSDVLNDPLNEGVEVSCQVLALLLEVAAVKVVH